MNIKAILFDKDGTLFDFHKTWGVWFYDCIKILSNGNSFLMNNIFSSVKFDLDKKQFLKDSSFIAGTLNDTIDEMLVYFPKKNKLEISEWFKQKSYEAKPIPIVCIKELLRDLIQKKIILGVATNDIEESAHHQLKITNIHNYFSYIYGCDSGFGSKPQSGMQNEFIKATNLETSSIMMVGDSIADMISGKNSGMISVGVLTGPAIKNDLEPYSDIILRSICDIPKYLDY